MSSTLRPGPTHGFAPGPVPASGADTAASAALRFGRFPITETQQFPPVAGPSCWVYLTLNAEIALSLDDSAALQALVRSPRARISVDGQWLWWALRRKYPQQPLRKMAGSDLLGLLAAHCSQQSQRLLLLGSAPGVNGAAVQRLRQRWPGLAVAGFAPPLYQPDQPAERLVLAQSLAAIHAYKPHYVVLGLGATREQRFAQALVQGLDGQVQGLCCFGGAIDLASGLVRRAPPLWQHLGLEGAWRVLQQPARLGRLMRVLRILPQLLRGDY